MTIAMASVCSLMKRSPRFGGRQPLNLALLPAAATGLLVVLGVFFVLALAFGVFMTLPIGGADMPVVVSLYSALSALAVAFEDYVLGNAAMVVAGTVVGAAGTLLT
jgi:NAD(P) transhydrogenase subunit beta